MGLPPAPEIIPTKMGRPRCFCEETALEAAMRVFWEEGYEGASLNDLTAAMGINRPSLYATFGDKQSLFLKAMGLYSRGPASYITRALEQSTVRQVAESLLYGAVDLLSDPANPRGCFSVQGISSAGPEHKSLKQAMIDYRKAGEALLRKRLKRARSEGDLPAGTDPAALTGLLSTVINGLGIQAANGATRAEMKRVADLALRTLPI